MPRVAATPLADYQSARIGLFRFYRHSAITARQPGSGCRLSKQSMPTEHSLILALPTERAYVGWLIRFIQHCGSPDLERFGEPEIKDFLTTLAVRGHVTAGPQNRAKCALLFLSSTVLGRELEFLDVARATKSPRLPVVLSRREIDGRKRQGPWMALQA
jgi:hypothetical protein